MSAILLRDLRSYAVTMTGWVFVAFILVFMGIFTMTYNLTGGYGNFEYVLSELKIVYLQASGRHVGGNEIRKLSVLHAVKCLESLRLRHISH